MAVLASVAAGALGVLASRPARAQTVPPKVLAAYCSPTGDLCLEILTRSGAVHLEIKTFAPYFTRYLLCVRPPRGSTTCRSVPIQPRGRVFGSSVRWREMFPFAGSGVYRVTWKVGATPLGPTLRFRNAAGA